MNWKIIFFDELNGWPSMDLLWCVPISPKKKRNMTRKITQFCGSTMVFLCIHVLSKTISKLLKQQESTPRVRHVDSKFAAHQKKFARFNPNNRQQRTNDPKGPHHSTFRQIQVERWVCIWWSQAGQWYGIYNDRALSTRRKGVSVGGSRSVIRHHTSRSWTTPSSHRSSSYVEVMNYTIVTPSICASNEDTQHMLDRPGWFVLVTFISTLHLSIHTYSPYSTSVVALTKFQN